MSAVTGVVVAVNLTDSGDEVNTIWVSINKNGNQGLEKASPLNMNVRYIPIKGELVYLVSATSQFGDPIGATGGKYYYTSPVSVHKNINHNAFPNSTDLELVSAPSFGTISAGIPSSNSSDDTNDFGNGFVELTNLPQLQGYLGDTIFEGRFGQSIRFGYTPENITTGNNSISAVSKTPSWSSTKPESPITIIRNGVTTNDGYNKFVVEDINKDASSIWLTDQQTIKLKLSNKVTLGVTPVSTYKSPQLILNSDRVVINSKKDSVIISGKKSVNISTKGWKADMDVMFTQLEAIVNALNSLAPQLAGAVTSAGAPVPLVQTGGGQLQAAISQIKSQLQLMKQ